MANILFVISENMLLWAITNLNGVCHVLVVFSPSRSK